MARIGYKQPGVTAGSDPPYEGVTGEDSCRTISCGHMDRPATLTPDQQRKQHQSCEVLRDRPLPYVTLSKHKEDSDWAEEANAFERSLQRLIPPDWHYTYTTCGNCTDRSNDCQVQTEHLDHTIDRGQWAEQATTDRTMLHTNPHSRVTRR